MGSKFCQIRLQAAELAGTRQFTRQLIDTVFEDSSLTLLKTVHQHFFPSFFLSLLVLLILEHYTRECEFGNFDKMKNKNNTHKKTQKKHKNFWLNFRLNKECPKLLCGLGIGHKRRQTIPMWTSWGEKGILQGITVCLVSAVLSTM